MEQELIEGVDGSRYKIGSSEHRLYVQRFDAAYRIVHQKTAERNAIYLRNMVNLDDRIRNDAGLTAFLAGQLVYARGTIERTIYETLRMRQLVTPDTSHPRGAKYYSMQMLDHVGEARVTHDLAGDDPTADVVTDEEARKYANVRGKYFYTVADLEHSAFSGVPLQTWKAEACADMIARGVDKIGRSGHAKLGLTGLFNNPYIPILTLTNGEWPTATVDEIVADLQEIEATLIAQSGDTLPPGGYRLILPTTYEGLVTTLPRSDASDLTVRNWFLANSRVITSIERYGALDDAVSPDIAPADAPMAIALPNNIAAAGLFWPMPIVYEELPPQADGWMWTVRARARVGGVEIRRPLHALYVQNLD